jgi:hypothetical protein
MAQAQQVRLNNASGVTSELTGFSRTPHLKSRVECRFTGRPQTACRKQRVASHSRASRLIGGAGSGGRRGRVQAVGRQLAHVLSYNGIVVPGSGSFGALGGGGELRDRSWDGRVSVEHCGRLRGPRKLPTHPF